MAGSPRPRRTKSRDERTFARQRRTLLALGFLLCLRSTSLPAEEAAVDFERDVKPILQERCFACHGALKQESGLRLDAVHLARRGGEGGPAVVPGKSASSPIIERVSSANDAFRMPPEGRPLTPAEITRLKAWIDAGAPAPEDDRPQNDPRRHWAFRRPARPTVSTTVRPDWSTNPIDALIAREHETRGLNPVRPTSPELLLRRLYIDLIGLPPPRAAVHDFVTETRGTLESDAALRAVSRVTEELLASPQYGERWGRHWMDVWRYTDWYGLGAQLRNSQKHIWHWRDWIIESLNADKGYDQMLREMLAADELYPEDADAVRATGFLARNYYLFNRTTWLDDTIEHTSKALLGLTMNCAKCHDHKYDPLTQVDYYRFRAIFEPHQVRLDPVPGELDLEKDGVPRVFDGHPDAKTYVHVRGNEKDPDTSRTLAAAVPTVLATDAFRVKEVTLPLPAYFPALRPHVLTDLLTASRAAHAAAEKEVAVARTELAAVRVADGSAEIPSTPPGAEKREQPKDRLRVAEAQLRAARLHTKMLVAVHAADVATHDGADPQRERAETRRLVASAAQTTRSYELAKAEEDVLRSRRRVHASPEGKRSKAQKALNAAEERLSEARQAVETGDDTRYTPLRAARKALEGPAEKEESRNLPFPSVSTGRRSALAHWLVDPRNPLVARVAVNHIWMRHFGEPLVENVTDFGLRAPRPPLHELLDWLAVELIESGWSMKHLHRLIVTSRVYALATSTRHADPTTQKKDPGNVYYWRRRPLRMESQVIRDSLLALAGRLRLKLGGPALDAGADGEALQRRSLYFKQSRDDQNKFLSMFDDADILRCYRRTESIVPQQALALANSRLALDMTRELTTRIENMEVERDGDTDFVRAAFETILCTSPTSAEVAACQETLSAVRQQLARDGHTNPAQRARASIVHALINHNDFITLR